MALIDALKILQSGRTLRGSLELDEALMSFRVQYNGDRRLTFDLDEISLDDPIPFELTELGKNEAETQPDDFPDEDLPQ